MSDVYTAEEFAACYSLRGYGSKKDALKWLEENGMRAAEESDFEKCYHALDQPVMYPRQGKYIALGADGWNPSAPGNQPNSRGKSFNAMMRRAQRELDALEKTAKKTSEENS